jgi:hypothetical protein
MSSYDAGTQLDLSAYPGLSLATLLSWPLNDLIAQLAHHLKRSGPDHSARASASRSYVTLKRAISLSHGRGLRYLFR